jgi:hypothetical protein
MPLPGGRKSIVHTEYSYTVDGRIDIFLKSRQWGIECIKDGDRMSHVPTCNPFPEPRCLRTMRNRFGCIISNFCTKRPKRKQGMISSPSHYGLNYRLLRCLFYQISRNYFTSCLAPPTAKTRSSILRYNVLHKGFC